MAAMLWLMTVLACSEVGPPPREHPADRKTVAQTDAEAISQMTASANGSGAPQVVALIVLDTVRADHLDVYGYATETMPKLRDWSKGATVYESARSPSSWTLPAHASLFTGQLPRTHGSRGRAPGTRAALPAPPLAADADTIAEAFQAAGWNTVAVVANKGFMSPIFGLDQGFDHYLHSEARGHEHVSTDGVTEQAISLLDEFEKSDRPFFLFVLYFDPHYEYRRHPEFGFAPDRVGLGLGGLENPGSALLGGTEFRIDPAGRDGPASEDADDQRHRREEDREEFHRRLPLSANGRERPIETRRQVP